MKSEIPTSLLLDDVDAPVSASGAKRESPRSRWARLGALTRRGLTLPFLALIWIYQRALSPSIPAIFGPTCSCRYYPTCSQYAVESLRTHGVAVGLVLAAGRLLRCTPFHRGGLDPVPAPGVVRRLCRRVHLHSASA